MLRVFDHHPMRTVPAECHGDGAGRAAPAGSAIERRGAPRTQDPAMPGGAELSISDAQHRVRQSSSGGDTPKPTLTSRRSEWGPHHSGRELPASTLRVPSASTSTLLIGGPERHVANHGSRDHTGRAIAASEPIAAVSVPSASRGDPGAADECNLWPACLALADCRHCRTGQSSTRLPQRAAPFYRRPHVLSQVWLPERNDDGSVVLRTKVRVRPLHPEPQSPARPVSWSAAP